MFPREFIENFLKDYSPAEIVSIKKDLAIAQQLSFDEAQSCDEKEVPVYLASAGGPGSAKSTTLEAFIETHGLANYVYADPDQVYLKNMLSYRKWLTSLRFALANSNRDCLKQAYDKWRAASNYICHEVLQRAFAGKYPIAHGTTSTSPHIESLYQKIKAQGYQIHLLLCYSPDELRQTSIAKRETEQGFVQTDPKEVISKGADFPKRFNIYFDYADQMTFYWNDELVHRQLPTPCATFTKTDAGPILEVLNEKDWHQFCHKYLADIARYKIEPCVAFKDLIPKAVLMALSSAQLLTRTGLYSASLVDEASKTVAASNTRLTCGL